MAMNNNYCMSFAGGGIRVKSQNPCMGGREQIFTCLSVAQEWIMANHRGSRPACLHWPTYNSGYFQKRIVDLERAAKATATCPTCSGAGQMNGENYTDRSVKCETCKGYGKINPTRVAAYV